MILEVAYSALSLGAFVLGALLLLMGVVLVEVPAYTLALLYPWWRLRQGWRLRLFPDHISLHPPLGFGRRIFWERVRGVEVDYWPAGTLSRGRRALVLGIPLPVPDPEALAARIRELLEGQTLDSGSRGG